jgi:hypothetical protein
MSGLSFEEPILPLETEKTSSLEYKFSSANKSFGDISCEVQAHSAPTNSRFEVRRLTITLPKFWKWGQELSSKGAIPGKLTFKLVERNPRLIMWMRQCFQISLSKE